MVLPASLFYTSPNQLRIYDSSPPLRLPGFRGSLPPDLDPSLAVPSDLSKITSPSKQERYTHTPIYSALTLATLSPLPVKILHRLTIEKSTNVPAIAMPFSDLPFAYGPFVAHHIPKRYIESYFAHHQVDSLLSLNTTVEDVSLIKSANSSTERGKLTLRKHDSVRQVDVWWEDDFDAVVLANGHYSVRFVEPPFSTLPAFPSL
jgi:hypothetical protein